MDWPHVGLCRLGSNDGMEMMMKKKKDENKGVASGSVIYCVWFKGWEL